MPCAVDEQFGLQKSCRGYQGCNKVAQGDWRTKGKGPDTLFSDVIVKRTESCMACNFS